MGSVLCLAVVSAVGPLFKLFCVMFFPRLNEDIILKTTPSNVSKKFKNYGGPFDATELRLRVASELMCQRATWSQYKHGNKYSQVLSSDVTRWRSSVCLTWVSRPHF
jgi:hypothetical protein